MTKKVDNYALHLQACQKHKGTLTEAIQVLAKLDEPSDSRYKHGIHLFIAEKVDFIITCKDANTYNICTFDGDHDIHMSKDNRLIWLNTTKDTPGTKSEKNT